LIVAALVTALVGAGTGTAIIIRCGTNISVGEVEGCLITHPVAAVAVVAYLD